jgi:hypothetical protein
MMFSATVEKASNKEGPITPRWQVESVVVRRLWESPGIPAIR